MQGLTGYRTSRKNKGLIFLVLSAALSCMLLLQSCAPKPEEVQQANNQRRSPLFASEKKRDQQAINALAHEIKSYCSEHGLLPVEFMTESGQIDDGTFRFRTDLQDAMQGGYVKSNVVILNELKRQKRHKLPRLYCLSAPRSRALIKRRDPETMVVTLYNEAGALDLPQRSFRCSLFAEKYASRSNLRPDSYFIGSEQNPAQNTRDAGYLIGSVLLCRLQKSPGLLEQPLRMDIAWNSERLSSDLGQEIGQYIEIAVRKYHKDAGTVTCNVSSSTLKAFNKKYLDAFYAPEESNAAIFLDAGIQGNLKQNLTVNAYRFEKSGDFQNVRAEHVLSEDFWIEMEQEPISLDMTLLAPRGGDTSQANDRVVNGGD